MRVAVTHRLHPARLGRCYDSFNEVDGIPGSCEIIAASFSAMVMQFVNDPGKAGTGPPPDGHVWVTPTRLPEPPAPAAAGFARRRVRRGRAWACPLFPPPGAAEVSGVKGSPQGCRAQRDAQHP
jgi:hypothetical protein